MKKQLVFFGIIMILTSIGLSRCGSTEKATVKTPKELIFGNWDAEIEDI